MMSLAEANEIRLRACKDKKRYENAGDAQATASLRNKALKSAPGDATWIAKYRCPFCGFWHLGHVMSVGSMERMALAIRIIGGDGPGEPSGTVSRRERRRQRRSARVGGRSDAARDVA